MVYYRAAQDGHQGHLSLQLQFEGCQKREVMGESSVDRGRWSIKRRGKLTVGSNPLLPTYPTACLPGLPPSHAALPEKYQEFTLCSLYAENRRGEGGEAGRGTSVVPPLPKQASNRPPTPLTGCRAKQQFVLWESPPLEIETAFLRSRVLAAAQRLRPPGEGGPLHALNLCPYSQSRTAKDMRRV